jgi:hypothetical protein
MLMVFHMLMMFRKSYTAAEVSAVSVLLHQKYNQNLICNACNVEFKPRTDQGKPGGFNLDYGGDSKTPRFRCKWKTRSGDANAPKCQRLMRAQDFLELVASQLGQQVIDDAYAQVASPGLRTGSIQILYEPPWMYANLGAVPPHLGILRTIL